MSTMIDAVSIGAIPDDAQIVGCYVNGDYRNDGEARARFPDATLVPIWVYIPGRTVDGDWGGRMAVAIARELGLAPGSTVVLDVEASDAGGAGGYARDWCDAVRAAGYSPTIYTSLSTWGVLADYPANPDDWWIAEYTNRPHLIDGAAACQWTAPEAGSPGDYDISECRDGWPRRGVPVDPDPLHVGGRLLVPMRGAA